MLDVFADISIHVPREGHDTINALRIRRSREFQSTCPARGTTADKSALTAQLEISIHVPREGHDCGKHGIFLPLSISIHVPREGHDIILSKVRPTSHVFQSTCPARGTTMIIGQ